MGNSTADHKCLNVMGKKNQTFVKTMNELCISLGNNF